MSTKRIAFLLVFFAFIAVPLSVRAAKSDVDNNRYFIKSSASLWKGSFGVRHTFENGFTSDLSDWQLRLAKIFGLEIEPVGKLFILPDKQTSLLTGVETEQSNRVTPTEHVPWNIGAIVGNQDLTHAGKGVTVAVLDTGVFKSHPDLERRITDCQDFTNIKPAILVAKCDDKNGHGTHVAGIIAADGGADSQGIWGIAPAANIFAYKVCDTAGSCWADDVAVAIDTAVENKANIINLSIGSDQPRRLVDEAVNRAIESGVVVVAAAGNDGPYAGSMDYPAAHVGVQSVGAIDANNQVPEWSSRGLNGTLEGIDGGESNLQFVAPGDNIESTWKDGNYAVLSGTSMAAPHISGLAARLLNLKSKHPAKDVEILLNKLTTDIGATGEDPDSGSGFPTLAK